MARMVTQLKDDQKMSNREVSLTDVLAHTGGASKKRGDGLFSYFGCV